VAWPAAVLALLVYFAGSMWIDSTDLAHHYALVSSLSEHWAMPSATDRTLGEMLYYPRGAHLLAALLSQLLHSDLLAMQMLALAAVIGIWASLILLLQNLPATTRWCSLLVLLALLWLNRKFPMLELHGAELVTNYFFAQIVAQAGALAMLVLTLYGERGRQAGALAWRRNALLLAACWLLAAVHLLPAVQLFGVFAVLLVLDALASRTRSGWLPGLAWGGAWFLAGGLMMLKHPSFHAMKEISRNDGAIHFALFGDMSVLIAWCLLLLLASSLMLWRWLRLSAEKQALWLVWKMVGAWGLAVCGMCLLQVLAWRFGGGSAYAVKKHLFALNTLALLQLALWLGWYGTRLLRSRHLPLPHGVAALLLVLVVGLVLPSPSIKRLDVAELVAKEREMLTLRTLIGSTPGKHTYVLKMAPGAAFVDYMFSIGVFKAPRFRAGYELYVDQPFAKSSLLGAVITRSHSELDQYPACRRLLTPHGLVWLDAACLKRAAGKTDSWFSLIDDAGELPCQLDGFGATEPIGRWSNRREASIRCQSPLVTGQLSRHLLIEAEAFLGPAQQNVQRVQILQHGVVTNEFRFDRSHPYQILDIALQTEAQAGANGEFDVTLRLPDARSPKSLGMGADGRELSLAIMSLEFR
jgi:hypothetical protein